MTCSPRRSATPSWTAGRVGALPPLHINVFARTHADLGGLSALDEAVRQAGRLPWEVTLDVVPPYAHVPRPALLEALSAVRERGFRIGADGVGDGDMPLRLPADVPAGRVRALLTGAPEVTGVLMVDGHGVPPRSVHRSRFLLMRSGRYGHALYADRPAARLGDPPRTVDVDASAREVLDMIARGTRERTSDDVAVVDRRGRCVGVVRPMDLVRALAESRVEEAAGLNPLTRLPGSDAITSEVDRRIRSGRAFSLSRLDIDRFKQVDDGAGFAAGDELIRSVGRSLEQAASGTTRVGHIGGDDFLLPAGPGALDPRRPPCWAGPGRRAGCRAPCPWPRSSASREAWPTTGRQPPV